MPSEVPNLPGYVLGRPLDPERPAGARVAHDLGSGGFVVVRRAPAGSSTADLRRRFAAVPAHPHLLAVDVVEDTAGHPVLVGRLARGGGLDRRLAGGPLPPGEAAVLGRALADALAALHGAGLALGGLRAADVLLGPRPLLDPARLATASADADPADDQAALEVLLHAVSLQRPPSAEPARGPVGSPRRGPSSHRRRRRQPRRSWVVLAAITAVVGAVAAVPVLSGSGPARSGSAVHPVEAVATPPTRAPGRLVPSESVDADSTGVARSRSAGDDGVDWRAVLARVDTARADALRRGDPTALATAEVPGSPAYQRDLALLRELDASGLRPDAAPPTLLQVRSVTVAAGRAVLRIVDRLAAVRFVDAEGRVAGTQPSRPATGWWVTLWRSPNGLWRVHDVTRPQAGSGEGTGD